MQKRPLLRERRPEPEAEAAAASAGDLLAEVPRAVVAGGVAHLMLSGAFPVDADEIVIVLKKDGGEVEPGVLRVAGLPGDGYDDDGADAGLAPLLMVRDPEMATVYRTIDFHVAGGPSSGFARAR